MGFFTNITGGEHMQHLATIELIGTFSSTSGQTLSATGGVYIGNIFNQGYDVVHMFFDNIGSSADTDPRFYLLYGTPNGSTQNGAVNTVVGYLNSARQNGTTLDSSDTYHVGCNSGPDQDGGTHNFSYTNQNHYDMTPLGADQAISSWETVVHVPQTSQLSYNNEIMLYSHGLHGHTTTAMGPFQSSAKSAKSGGFNNVCNGFFFQTASGTWTEGKIRVYGRQDEDPS